MNTNMCHKYLDNVVYSQPFFLLYSFVESRDKRMCNSVNELMVERVLCFVFVATRTGGRNTEISISIIMLEDRVIYDFWGTVKGLFYFIKKLNYQLIVRVWSVSPEILTEMSRSPAHNILDTVNKLLSAIFLIFSMLPLTLYPGPGPGGWQEVARDQMSQKSCFLSSVHRSSSSLFNTRNELRGLQSGQNFTRQIDTQKAATTALLLSTVL